MRSRASFFHALLLVVLFSSPASGVDPGADIALALQALHQGDYRAAASRLQPLADAGNPEAQYELGVLYGNGDGVPQDLAQSLKWLRLAAKGGHAKAREGVAFMELVGAAPEARDKKPERKEDVPLEPDNVPLTAPALIQIATVKDENVAMAEWRRQQRRYPEQLGQLNPVVQPFDAGARGILFRVQGGPIEFEHAKTACETMRQIGGVCMVIRQTAPARPPE